MHLSSQNVNIPAIYQRFQVIFDGNFTTIPIKKYREKKKYLICLDAFLVCI